MLSFPSQRLKISLFLALSLSLCLAPCKAMSFIALDMRKPEKCVRADYPAKTRVRVLYDILDPKKDHLSMGLKYSNSPLSDSRITFKFKTIPNTRGYAAKNDSVNREVSEISGKIDFQGENEGKVEVCVRIDEIQGKKYIKPVLVGFRLQESGEADEEDKPAAMSPEDKKIQDMAKNHMSDMERILHKMNRDANLLLKNADMIKDDESAFHKQSVEMNAATKWWPMLHIVVLLVMGFTQANHIIKFFKGKHII